MDVLSDAIAAARTGRPHCARLGLHPPFSLRFPPVDGASFHILLQGGCWLIAPQGPAIEVGVGDVLLLPRAGAYSITDDPAAPATIQIRAEDLRAITPLGRYENTGDGPAVDLLCGAYLLDRARPHPLLRELPDLIHLPSRLVRHPALRAVVDLLGAEITDPQPGAGALVPALLDCLLLYTLRAWMDEQAEAGWPAALRDQSIAAALRVLHADPARPWTVEELGAEGGLSRSAFSRRFTALVGQPPLAYLTWWRMTSAARLLREQHLTLAAVAKKVGYRSEYAFGIAFKREYGIAPGKYREQHADRGMPSSARARPFTLPNEQLASAEAGDQTAPRFRLMDGVDQ